jgi:hypothetical protein
LPWIEKIPIITAAPSGIPTMVVKLRRPCLTCTVCFFPLSLLF